jgi:hypothetical protein
MSADSAITWVSGHADILKLSAAVLLGLSALIAAVIWTRRWPSSRRLLALSVALTTGLSADSMWRVAGRVLHLRGPEQAILFGFGEVSLLVAAKQVNEALVELRELAVATGGSEADQEIREARKVAALRRARAFSVIVWLIAVGIGVAATTAATSTGERAIRLIPPVLVAGFWWASLDKSGMAVTREAITSRLSVRRIAVWLGVADPGKVGLEQADRRRRLHRLAGRLFAYHQTEDSTLARRIADWRLARADSAARRYLDADGRATVAAQLAARYTLRDGTSKAALAGTNPWQVPQQLPGDPNVIEGSCVEPRTADSGLASGQRTAAGLPDSVGQRRTASDSGQPTAVTGRRTAGSRTVVPLPQRTAGQSVQDMAAWLSGQPEAADRIPGRPTAVALLRGQFGSCSTGRAIDVIALLAAMRTADSGQETRDNTNKAEGV